MARRPPGRADVWTGTGPVTRSPAGPVLRSLAVLAVLGCGPGGSREFVNNVSPPDQDGGRRPPASGGEPAGGAGGISIGGEGGAGGMAGTGEPPPDAGTRPFDAPPDLRLPPDAPVPDAADPDLPPAPDAPPPRPDAPIDTATPPPPPPPDAAPPSTLNDGLIARFRLDEPNGNAVTDDAGGDNNGTLSGPARVQGGFPQAKYPNPGSLLFDGNNDFVELATRNLPANNRPQTVAFWFNYTAIPASESICVSLTDAQGGGSRLKLGFRAGQVAAWKGGNTNLVGSPVVAPGWHHYAYTFDGTIHLLYLDGKGTSRSTAAPDTGAVASARLGAGFDNAENYAGQLDEVRIYNRSLRPEEVAQLAMGQQ